MTPTKRLSSIPISGLLTIKPDGYIARKALVLDIQRALIRAGCYRGETTGQWGADTKRALGTFLTAANARLPIEKPDYILLSLIQGHIRVFCGGIDPADTQMLAPLESDSRRSVPPGLMGIGGPKLVMSNPSAKPAASAALSYEPAKSITRKLTRRNGSGGAYVTPPPRAPSEMRAVRELLTHPLGSF